MKNAQDNTEIEDGDASDFDVTSQTATTTPQAAAETPSAAQTPASPAAAAQEEKLPSDLKAAIALVQEAEALPTRNARESAIREARLRVVRKHFFDLQQGLPTIHVPGDHIASVGRMLTEASQMLHMEQLSMVDPIVREFFSAYKSLRAHVEKNK